MTRLAPRLRLALLGAATTILIPAAAFAQPVEKPKLLDSVVIGDPSAGPGSSAAVGAVAVNAVAGNGNQQANAATFATGDLSLSTALVIQHMGPKAEPEPDPALAPDEAPASLLEDSPRDRIARIEGGAFTGAQGLIAVNVASGDDNQQANVAAIAIGLKGPVLADTMLSQSRAEPDPEGTLDESAPPGSVATGFGDDAFAGASGLVQVSLLGGERNSSANTFSLSVTAGGGE